MDIQDIVNKVLQQKEDTEQKQIKNYIDSVVTSTMSFIRSDIALDASFSDPEVRKRLEKWANEHKHSIAFQAGECLRIILTQELLGGGE